MKWRRNFNDSDIIKAHSDRKKIAIHHSSFHLHGSARERRKNVKMWKMSRRRGKRVNFWVFHNVFIPKKKESRRPRFADEDKSLVKSNNEQSSVFIIRFFQSSAQRVVARWGWRRRVEARRTREREREVSSIKTLWKLEFVYEIHMLSFSYVWFMARIREWKMWIFLVRS